MAKGGHWGGTEGASHPDNFVRIDPVPMNMKRDDTNHEVVDTRNVWGVGRVESPRRNLAAVRADVRPS